MFGIPRQVAVELLATQLDPIQVALAAHVDVQGDHADPKAIYDLLRQIAIAVSDDSDAHQTYRLSYTASFTKRRMVKSMPWMLAYCLNIVNLACMDV
jgi:hypothetical protein